MIAKVLFVTANALKTEPLQLDREHKAILDALRGSAISLVHCPAATIHDLQNALMAEPFHVLHVSSHGGSEGSLELIGDDGERFFVPQQALADELRAYRAMLRCVVLNACYSLSQATLISMGVDVTIGMDGAVGDTAAVQFAGGFYSALAAGNTIEFAYDRGCGAVALEYLTLEQFKPVLLRNGETLSAPPDPSMLSIRVESTTSGKIVDVKTPSNVSIKGFLQRIQPEFDVKDYADAGGVKIWLAWVLVDANADKEYRALHAHDRESIRAYIKTPQGIYASYEANEALEEIGAYDGMKCHLYPVQDVAHGPAGPLGYDEEG